MIPRETIDRVISAIDTKALVGLTRDIVRINSVWDPVAGTSEAPVAEWIMDWARRQGFDPQMDEVAPGRPNVIIPWAPGRGRRTLMFEGHTDVVTPGDHSAWTHDPFAAEIVGRRMYGRGTNDTKGNLAAMLTAMAALKRSGVELAGTIIGGVLCDEEDQMLGVKDFIARGHADAVTGAIICEPQDGLVCISQKGAIRTRYTVTGRMSHGAMPLSGLNSAPAIARIIDGLHDLEAAAVQSFGKDPLLGWPSFTPTVVQAPSAGAPQLNVMPRQAVLLVDLRTTPAQSHDTIRQDLAALAAETVSEVRAHYKALDERLQIHRDHDLDVTVEFLTDRPCTHTDVTDPVVAAADWGTRVATGKNPTHAGVPGATDGTFLWSLKDIPIVTMGAGDREVPHQVDEWIDLDQLIETARIYALAALHYLHPKEPDDR